MQKIEKLAINRILYILSLLIYRKIKLLIC